jgi:predicted TIM-barrel fold metal-dependent hydrolase
MFGPATKYPFAPDSSYTAPDATAEDNIALQDRLGLAWSVIVSPGAYGRDYTLMADTLARYPNRFRGVALLKDDTSDSEIARLTKLGVRGVRQMSAKRGAHVPQFSPTIAARAHEHGWHLQFYTHEGDIADYADKLLATPNTIVLDHFGAMPAAAGVDQPAFKTIRKMLETGRVWVKLSAPMRSTKFNYPYSELMPFAHALVKHAPERLVWGTDWPHVNMNDLQMPNDGDLVDLIPEWIRDEATRKRILVDNPAKLYAYKPKA